MNCYPTYPTVTPQQCNLIVTAGNDVWGTIYINGQSTGQYIDYQTKPTVTIHGVPCNQAISVWITDVCGYQSHTETVFASPGQNTLYFAYW